MSRLAPYIAALQDSLGLYLQQGRPVPLEVLPNVIRLLELYEVYVTDLEAKLDPSKPFEADNVVFLDAWLRARTENPNAPERT